MAAWGYSSVVERSLSMGEGWGSIPHTSRYFSLTSV
uniref:Uncharacterized protein n=1 Tax=Heterorhabditis bacteriophora TaxID=37862 RepID=A0A1I7WA02_HETBA